MASPNINISNIVATINEGIGQTDLGSVTADMSVTWEVLNNANVNIMRSGSLNYIHYQVCNKTIPTP